MYHYLCLKVATLAFLKIIKANITSKHIYKFVAQMKNLLFIITCLLSVVACTPEKKPNVLFICVDDLRTELNCYGEQHIKSPNLDNLAKSGSIFTSHFVNIPTCGASRQCLLTGMLPRTTKHLQNSITSKTLAIADEKAIPETFIHQLKRNGYYTVGIGKISHHPDGYVYGYIDPQSEKLELPYSWNEMLLNSEKWGSGHDAFFGYADGSNRNTLEKNVKPYEMADVSDEEYPDGLISQLAVSKLKELKEKNQPFFLGVGFFKPHLPFTAPKKYWDMYDENNLPIAPYANIPENSSRASLHGSGEFNQYKLGEEKASLNKPVSDEYARKLRHGYFACISYIDAQIGKVLNELEAQGLSENTIVVVWGDHGWHLGDHRVWGKHTIFDKALKSTLIMRAPNKKKGQTINQIVSTTDIYPTIMDLCNVNTEYPLDGESLNMLLNDPEDKDWRNTAYSYFNSGVSLRTDSYRLSKYYRSIQPKIELYNIISDPNETKNIAKDNQLIIDSLNTELDLGDTGLFLKK